MEVIKSQELTIGNLKMEFDICEKKNGDLLQQVSATNAPSVEDDFRREIISRPNDNRHVNLFSMAPQ